MILGYPISTMFLAFQSHKLGLGLWLGSVQVQEYGVGSNSRNLQAYEDELVFYLFLNYLLSKW